MGITPELLAMLRADGYDLLSAEEQTTILNEIAQLKADLIAKETNGNCVVEADDVYITAMSKCAPNASFYARLLAIINISIDHIIEYLYM